MRGNQTAGDELMTTDNAIRAEADYRSGHHVEGPRRAGARRLLVRIVWRPKDVIALVAAIRRTPTGHEAVRDVMAAVDLPTALSAGRV
jgi:hypothetical protein